MADDGRVVLRSYRLAFEVERRLHRIDRYRIPLPYGLPLAALGYAAALLVVVLALRGVPIAGAALRSLPLPVQLVFVPGVGAHVLCRVTADGRPAHEVLLARALFLVRPKELVALRARPAAEDLERSIVVAPDERGATLRAGSLGGGVEVALRAPARLVRGRRPSLEGLAITSLKAPRRIVVADGQRLTIR